MALLLVIGLPAGAQERCALALLLAVDVSGSVDAAEYALQTDGVADALADGEIRRALLGGPVALAVMQWSAPGMQKLTVGWMLMDAPERIDAFARRARTQERAFERADTAIADAISAAVGAFERGPRCRHRVLDISGDGVQNAGGPLALARDGAAGVGITINGIAIEGIGPTIRTFYMRQVITRGGFVLTAETHSDYPRAIREKIRRETAVPSG